MSDPTPADFVSTTDVARMAATTSSTVARWIQDGRLPAFRFGRNFKIRREDAEAFVAQSYTGFDR